MTRRKKPNNMLVRSAERPEDPSDLENAIRTRAFELYEGRGKAGGNATEDWLRAEAEVVAMHRDKTQMESRSK